MQLQRTPIKRLVRFTSSLACSPGDIELLGSENSENIKKLLKSAPTIRPPKPNDKSIKRDRKSAVLVPLIISNKKPSVIFTVRSNLLNKHRGEISFPGGSLDAIDEEDCTKAALRETKEEISLDGKDIQILGELPETLGRAAVVVPVVGLVNERIDVSRLKFDTNEVSEIFTISLEHFCQSDHHGYTQFRNGYSLPLFVSKDGHRIWGITAIIMHQILRSLLPDYYKPKLKYIRPLVV